MTELLFWSRNSRRISRTGSLITKSSVRVKFEESLIRGWLTERTAASFFKCGSRWRDRALAAAVERSARQCYVVEGFYPPSLTYLEENYGLQINTDEYRVVYSVFASNIAPSVRVLRKK